MSTLPTETLPTTTTTADCAVCAAGYSPGYSRTCKSCMGDSKKSALAIAAVIGALALAVVVALVARLVSVVEVGPPQQQGSKKWRRTCSAWQARVRQTVPLTAVKIVVVVWQIVTQVCFSFSIDSARQ